MDLLPFNQELIDQSKLKEQEKPKEQELPLLGDIDQRNEKLDQHLDMQSTIIRSGLDHSDPVQNYLEVKSEPDKPGQLQNEIAKKNALDIAKVDNWLRQQYATTPEELKDLTDKGKALLNEYKMEHSGPVSNEQAVVDQLTNMDQPFDLRKARQVNAVLRLAVSNDIQKIAANQGWLDYLYENIGIYLLPFGTTSFPKDVKDVVGGTMFANGKQLQNFILGFKSLPQERQLVLYPYYRDLILRQTDSNQSNATDLLLGLIEPGSEKKLKNKLYEDSVFAALGIPTIASISRTVYGVGKSLVKLTNAAKLAHDVGNKDLAAEIVTSSMADKTGVAAAASKLEPEDAMRAAVPFKVTGVDESQMSELAPAVQKNVAEYLDKLSEVNAGLSDGSLTIRDGYVTEKEAMDATYKEIDEVRNTVKDTYNGKAVVKNVSVVKSDENSTLLSFDVVSDTSKRASKNIPVVEDKIKTPPSIPSTGKNTKLASELTALDKTFTFKYLPNEKLNGHVKWELTSNTNDIHKPHVYGIYNEKTNTNIVTDSNYDRPFDYTVKQLDENTKKLGKSTIIKTQAIALMKAIDTSINEGKNFAIDIRSATSKYLPVIDILNKNGYQFDLKGAVVGKLGGKHSIIPVDNIGEFKSLYKLKSVPYEYKVNTPTTQVNARPERKETRLTFNNQDSAYSLDREVVKGEGKVYSLLSKKDGLTAKIELNKDGTTLNLVNAGYLPKYGFQALSPEAKISAAVNLYKKITDFALSNGKKLVVDTKTFPKKQLEYFKLLKDEGFVFKKNGSLLELKQGPITEEYVAASTDSSAKLKSTFNKTVTATRSDITGTLELTEVPTSKTTEYLFSPSFRYVKGELGNLSKGAAKALLTSNVNQNALRALWREANKGLKTSDLSKLDKVLMAGDTFEDASGVIGKNFTVMELRAGVETPFGIIKLDTEAQIASYYKNRAFMDTVADLENNELRVKLASQGFKSAFIDDSLVMVKPYETATAKAELTKGSIKRVLDIDEQKMLSVGESKDIITGKLDSKVLVRLQEDLQLDKLAADDLQEGEHIRYALISKQSIKDLPKDVLSRKVGYVPAIYKNEEFFVKQKIPYSSNDEQSFKTVTLSRFASKKQAQREAEALNARAIQEGKWDGKHPSTAPFMFLSDRELTVEQLLGDSSASGRTLVFGKRSTRDIPFGLQKTEPERISVIEAFDRNIRQLSKLMAYNAYRIRAEQMWVNTAKEWGFSVRSFNDDVAVGAKLGSQLMSLKNQIKAWNQIPTREERLWSQIWQSVHDWMVEGSYSVGVPKDSFSSILWLKHADPIKAARAAAFHPLLGMFNIAQLVVQSSQAAIAASLNPLNAVRAFKYANTLRLTDLMQNEKSLVANIEKLRAHPEFKEIGEDVHELVKLWQRSGFGLSSRINSNYEMASDVAGFSKNVMKSILEKGEFFYRAGVNFANRFTFANAYMEYKKLNPGKVTEAGLKEIIARTDRDTFHMLQSDKPPIYKSALSVPLQFSQIILKSVEAMLGKEFTWLQKAKILGGQFALFGLSGFNLSKPYEDSLRAHGIEPSELHGWQKGLSKFASGGLVELLPWLVLSADLDISNRVAIYNGAGQWSMDIVLDDRPLWQKGLGAVGTEGGRANRSLARLSTIAIGGLGDEPMTKAEIILGLQEILKIPSSTNNIITAIYMARLNKIIDKNGIPIVEKEFSTAEIIAQAVGFKPAVVSQTYELTRFNVLKTRDYEAVATNIVYFLNQYTGLYSDPDNKDLSISTRKALQVSLSPFNPVERAEILKIVKNKVENPKNKREIALRDFFINTVGPNFVNSLIEDKQEAINSGMIKE